MTTNYFVLPFSLNISQINMIDDLSTRWQQHNLDNERATIISGATGHEGTNYTKEYS